MCFGILYLAFVFFGIYFFAYIVCFKKHFVSISVGISIKGARSLPEAVLVLTLGIQTRHSGSIRLHVHLNILETCYQRSISLTQKSL